MLDASTLHSPLLLLLVTAAVVVAAGLLPGIPSEPLLVAVAAAAPPALLAPLVALATACGMSAKTLVYLGGRGAPRAVPERHRARLHRACSRLAGRRGLQRCVVLVSSATGVPPFYLVTALCGTLGLPLRDFVVAGSVGTAVRFALVLSLPRLFA